MMEKVSEDWLCRARKAKRMALIAHVSPDGDTVGATLALRLAFLSLGKAVDVICDGDVPRSMQFLPGAEAFCKPDEAQGPYDTAIAVDVSDRSLLGRSETVFDGAGVRLVIDHHATNTGYGDVNFIRGGEAACCLLAYEAILALGVPMDVPMGTCLMTGLSTDTGHFQYACTTEAALACAAHLRGLGVDISMITRMMYRTQSMERVRITRRAYDNLRFELGGRVGVITLSRKDFEDAGCTYAQADGLVNSALEVEGVRMAMLASERDVGIKLSLRAVEPDTVNDIAARFGGGGHAQAAGCTIQATLEEAVAMALAAMEEKL